MLKLWTAITIFGLIIWYACFFPREDSTFTIQEFIPAVADTFVITDRPNWVTPITIGHEVTVTVYHAVKEQTDSTPDVLADGTRIDVSKAGDYRYCALSRDLLERWKGPYAYGDTIYLDGAGKFSGPWVVKDTMNSRFTMRMDLLVDVGTRPYKFDVATIRKEI